MSLYKRRSAVAVSASASGDEPAYLFNHDNAPYSSLGDRILRAAQYGADIGAPVPVKYDADDSDGVDILSSPNHDFTDVAEQFDANMQSNAPAKKDVSQTE